MYEHNQPDGTKRMRGNFLLSSAFYYISLFEEENNGGMCQLLYHSSVLFFNPGILGKTNLTPMSIARKTNTTVWLSVCAYWTYIQNVFLILNFICSEINYVLFTMKLFQLKLCLKLWTDCTVLHWPKYIPNSCLRFQWPKLSHSTNIWT